MALSDNSSLIVDFQDIHQDAYVELDFQRIFRVPDNGYYIPTPYGWFPFVKASEIHCKYIYGFNIDDIIIPMYQSEALCIHFSSNIVDEYGTGYPFAIKIYIDKLNALNGKKQNHSINKGEYIFLKNYNILSYVKNKNSEFIQIVPIPVFYDNVNKNLKDNIHYYSLIIDIIPLKVDVFKNHYPEEKDFKDIHCIWGQLIEPELIKLEIDIFNGLDDDSSENFDDIDDIELESEYIDRDNVFDNDDWDVTSAKRINVKIINSLIYKNITGTYPCHSPLNESHYQKFGIPWLDWYSDQ
jgi:hypothetical protein